VIRAKIPAVIGFVLVCTIAVGNVFAQTTRPSDDSGEGNIELKATEITESLNNIIGTFKLQEMEIVGSQEKPQFNYILRWKDPVPFPEETDTVSGNLIGPQYAPLDSEGYREMIEMTTE
jgi:hypothetical protein